MRSVLNSITLSHSDDRAFLDATASLDQIKALASAHNPTAENTPPSASPPPPPTSR